ncbi:MAG TPA: hypothetical protein V6D07_15145 [Trichocoleus sp.]
MTSTTVLASAPDLSTDDYIVIGLATCFIRDEGEMREVTVAEPVPSAYLEAVFKDVPTSYKSLHGTTLGEILPEGRPTLVKQAPAETQLCNEFTDRVIAAARTYKSRPVAKNLVPVGTVRTDIQYSTAKKRLLDSENVVTADDNVKQHEYTHKVL